MAGKEGGVTGYKNLTDTITQRRLCADMFAGGKPKVSTIILSFLCPNKTREITKIICGMFPALEFLPLPVVPRLEIFWDAR